MAVEYVHSTEAQINAASITLIAPTGIQDGDILFVAISVRKAFGTANDPVAPDINWTQIGSAITITGAKYSIFWKRASSESGNYVFTSASGTKMYGIISCYRGCVLTDSPVDAYSSVLYTTADYICRAASITPSESNGMFIFAGYSATQILSNPPGMTNRHIVSGIASMYMSLADLTYSDISASGDKDAALVSITGSTYKYAFLVALKPEPEITTTTTTESPTTTTTTTNGVTTLIKSINDLIVAATKTINDLEEWKNVNGLE